FIHRYAQLGCGAFVASIHVSAQPVAPSVGIVDATGAPSSRRTLSWYGHAAPTMASPFLNIEISCDARPQYFLIRGRCCFSRLIAALNCCSFSSYGSVMPRFGWVFDR